jgi:hypothetical protein
MSRKFFQIYGTPSFLTVNREQMELACSGNIETLGRNFFLHVYFVICLDYDNLHGEDMLQSCDWRASFCSLLQLASQGLSDERVAFLLHTWATVPT